MDRVQFELPDMRDALRMHYAHIAVCCISIQNDKRLSERKTIEFIGESSQPSNVITTIGYSTQSSSQSSVAAAIAAVAELNKRVANRNNTIIADRSSSTAQSITQPSVLSSHTSMDISNVLAKVKGIQEAYKRQRKE